MLLSTFGGHLNVIFLFAEQNLRPKESLDTPINPHQPHH